MKSPTKKHENTAFIIFLRIIAAFAVVVIHTKSLTNFETKGYYFLHSCVLWCVPVFFMISGYIFLGLKTNITYNHLKKYIIRFIVTLFTIGYFYALLQRVFENGISILTFGYSFLDVLKGDLWDHMWYVYSIIGIYLVFPVLSAFVSNNRKNLYILTLICGIFNIVFNDISTMFDIGFTFPLTGYCFYVLMGAVMYSTEERLLKKAFVPSVLVLVSMIIGLAIGIFLLDINIKQSYTAIYVAIMSGVVFIICKNLFNNVKASKFVDSISKCTWGIYLVHPFFINLFHKAFGISIEGCKQLIAFPISCVIVFFISYFSVLILKRIPLINKII